MGTKEYTNGLGETIKTEFRMVKSYRMTARAYNLGDAYASVSSHEENKYPSSEELLEFHDKARSQFRWGSVKIFVEEFFTKKECVVSE